MTLGGAVESFSMFDDRSSVVANISATDLSSCSSCSSGILDNTVMLSSVP